MFKLPPHEHEYWFPQWPINFWTNPPVSTSVKTPPGRPIAIIKEQRTKYFHYDKVFLCLPFMVFSTGRLTHPQLAGLVAAGWNWWLKSAIFIAICKIVGVGLYAPPSLLVLTLQKLGTMLSNVQWAKKLSHKRSNFTCQANCCSNNKGKPMGN